MTVTPWREGTYLNQRGKYVSPFFYLSTASRLFGDCCFGWVCFIRLVRELLSECVICLFVVTRSEPLRVCERTLRYPVDAWFWCACVCGSKPTLLLRVSARFVMFD